MDAYPSALELMQVYLRDVVDTLVVATDNIKAGPLDFDQQQIGGVSISKAGRPRTHPNLPLVWHTVLLRVYHKTEAGADAIGNHIDFCVDKKNRILVSQPSTSEEFLVHTFDVVGGNTHHNEAQKVWTDNRIVHMMLGTEAVA